jgi:hypothetical protein
LKTFPAALIAVVVACSSESGPGTEPGPNAPPTASAGADQDVTRGTTVTLMGAATDPDGQSVTLTW